MTTDHKTAEIEKRNGSISPDEARQLLQDEAMQRSKDCQKEIEALITAILQKHNCTVTYYGMLRSGTWVPITDENFVRGQLKVIPL